MFVLLGISFVSLCFFYYEAGQKYIETWIKAMITWCVLLFAKTEIMSLYAGVSAASCAVFWLAVTAISSAYVTYRRKWPGIMSGLCAVKHFILHNKLLIIMAGGIVALALLTVPYNWDSMTYHLPRITYWAQNHSVAHYATNCIRQVASPPFHEFICLDIYIMSGKRDLLFNMVQCSAFLTNAWLVYEIARKLGCGEKFGKIGALLFLSMPIAFGEALTTQNDNLAALFLLTFVYYMMDLWDTRTKLEADRATCYKAVVMSVCIGLGYLTKPAVSIGMALLAVVLLVTCIIRKDSIFTLVRLLLAAAPIVAVIILPEAARNVQTFGAVFPTITGPRQLVGTTNLRYLFVNGLKNFAFNLPTRYITNSRDILIRIIYAVAAIGQVDVNDPGIAEDGKVFYLNAADDMGHDTAVSAAIVYISMVCFFWFLYHIKKADRNKRIYTCVVTFMYVMMCVLIRWEPFMSRYMVGYLTLLCPMAAVWIEDMALHAKSMVLRQSCVPVVCWIGITGVVTLMSYHAAIVMEQDMQRPEGYFRNYYNNYDQEYIQACELVKATGAESIGLNVGDEYEYPIWYMLKYTAVRMESVMVSNDTKQYEDTEYVPDCILSTSDLGTQVEFHGGLYDKLQGWESISVYMIQK